MNTSRILTASVTLLLSLSAFCGELEDGFANPPAENNPKASQEAAGDLYELKLRNDAALLEGKDGIACNPAWPAAQELISYAARCRYLLKAGEAKPLAESDFSASGTAAKAIRRDYKDGTTGYFVACPADAKRATAKLSFALTGKFPEFWDPATGKILRPAKKRELDGRTVVEWRADPGATVFVMFRPAEGKAKKEPKIIDSQIQEAEVTGTWSPEPTAGQEVSGAVYRFTDGLFKIPGYATVAWIDLGKAKGIVEVKVNGKKFPVLWKPPYRLDIVNALTFEADRHTTEPGAVVDMQSPLNVELKVTGELGDVTWTVVCD